MLVLGCSKYGTIQASSKIGNSVSISYSYWLLLSCMFHVRPKLRKVKNLLMVCSLCYYTNENIFSFAFIIMCKSWLCSFRSNSCIYFLFCPCKTTISFIIGTDKVSYCDTSSQMVWFSFTLLIYSNFLIQFLQKNSFSWKEYAISVALSAGLITGAPTLGWPAHASPLEPVIPDVSVLISGPPIKDPGALLRYALPIDNKAVREVQKPLEDITDSLKIAGVRALDSVERVSHPFELPIRNGLGFI